VDKGFHIGKLHRHGFGKGRSLKGRRLPAGGVKAGLLPLQRFEARVATFDPPELRVKAAHARVLRIKRKPLPGHGYFLLPSTDRAPDKWGRCFQDARLDPLVVRMKRQHVHPGGKFNLDRLILRRVQRIAERPFQQPACVEPGLIPHRPGHLDFYQPRLTERKNAAEERIGIRLLRLPGPK